MATAAGALQTLRRRQDGPLPLYTMSVAIGQACDFVVGARPRPQPGRKWKNLRAGTPVTLRMESGDAIFFDGGSVPHGIPRIHKRDTAPPFWQRARPKRSVTQMSLCKAIDLMTHAIL